MKKVNLFFILLINTVGVTQAKELKVGDILASYMQAWAGHNKEKIISHYADDVIWYNLSTDNTLKGKTIVGQKITEIFMSYVSNMYWVKNGDVFINQNTIIYEWLYGGTFNGKWGEIEIVGKPFKLKGISTTTINKDGLIIAQKDYYDLESFKRELGLIK